MRKQTVSKGNSLAPACEILDAINLAYKTVKSRISVSDFEWQRQDLSQRCLI